MTVSANLPKLLHIWEYGLISKELYYISDHWSKLPDKDVYTSNIYELKEYQIIAWLKVNPKELFVIVSESLPKL